MKELETPPLEEARGENEAPVQEESATGASGAADYAPVVQSGEPANPEAVWVEEGGAPAAEPAPLTESGTMAPESEDLASTEEVGTEEGGALAPLTESGAATPESEQPLSAESVWTEEGGALEPETTPVADGPEPVSQSGEPADAMSVWVEEGGAPADRETEAGSVSVDELLGPAAEAAPQVEDAQLRAVLEAIVYVAEEPLSPAQLAAALHQPAERIRTLMQQIAAEFDRPEHGITVREVAGGYKMATKPEHHEGVRAFVKSLKPPLKLSLPALETLAVIAYKQPVTAPEIMEIRGVQGAGVLKTLLDRKLIAVAGRKNVIGKPILYKTTKEFLIQFGLKDLSELPSLKEFEEIRRMAFSDAEAPATEAPAAEASTAPTAETTAETAVEAEAESPAPETPKTPPDSQAT